MKRVCNQNQERTKVVSIVRVCDPNEDFRDCERVGARISKSQGSVCVCVCCVSNAFQDYFDDAKKSRVKQISKFQESRFKIQESSFKNQDSRIMFQDSRFKNKENTQSR